MVALHERWLHTRVHRHTMQLLLLTLECTGLAGAAASAHASHAAPQLQAVQQLNKSAQHTQDLLKYASVAL